GTPDGAEIGGFYPRIISDEDYWRAQWGPDNKLSRGKTTKGYWNLLKGIPKCGCCGRTIIGLNTPGRRSSWFATRRGAGCAITETFKRIRSSNPKSYGHCRFSISH